MKNYHLQLISTLIFLFGFQLLLKAQQLPIFTQYREYHSFINPAVVGPEYLTQEYNLQTGASYRTNLGGIDGAPTSIFVRGDYIYRTSSAFDLSFGGYLLNYDTDPLRTTGAYGKVAALFSKDPYYGAFSVGFTFGAIQYDAQVSKLQPFHSNDALLAGDIRSKMTPDIGFGAFYYKQFRDGKFGGDVVYGGISVPQLLGNNIKLDDNELVNFKKERHVFGVAGFYKYFNELSHFHPSVWIKYVPGISPQIDVNAIYQHNRTFWLGTGFSTSKIAHLEAGLFLNGSKNNDRKSFKIGYGFDYALGDYQNLFGTAHELNLSFFMDTRKSQF